MFDASSRLRGALTLLLTTAALPAAAAHLEVQGGRSYMDHYGANAGFVEATFASHTIGNSGRLDWSPDVSAGWIDSRDVSRYRNAEFDTAQSVTLLAAGARI